MSIFPVGPQKEKALRDKMAELGIREDDIAESFIRAGGRGGQKVNKASTRVYLKHIPTGIEVKHSAERSQAINRYRARIILANKIERLIKGREAEEMKEIAKLRRQKRKRSKRAKEKMLEAKKFLSEKKRLRRPPPTSE